MVLFLLLCNGTIIFDAYKVRKETDFSKLLEELRDAGFNDYRMEELTGINRPNLTRLRQGKRKQPNYDDGAAIMEIYNKEVSGA